MFTSTTCILSIFLAILIPECIPKRVYYSSFVFMAVVDKKTGNRVEMCANYQQYMYQPIASSFEKAEPYNLEFWQRKYNNTDICPYVDGFFYKGSVIPLQFRIDDDGSPCTRPFVESPTSFRKASQYQENELISTETSAALFLVSRGRQFVQGWRDFLFNDFYDPYINESQSIPTFYIYNDVFQQYILSIPKERPVEIRFYRPEAFFIDPSMIIIWFLAMFCVTGGGVWAFYRHKWGKDEQENESLRANSREEQPESCAEKYASWLSIIFLMVMLVTIILIGYYFRSYIVVFFNLMMTAVGSTTLYECLRALLFNSVVFANFWRRMRFEIGKMSCNRTPTYCNLLALLLFAGTAGFCITWYVNRLEPYAFIALNIINVSVCLHILKSLRLPNLKWISTLMIAMYIYDAIMVFVTPLWTPNGCSVMLEVATGIDCSTPKKNETGYPLPPIDTKTPEKFPMLMQVPHLDPMISCTNLEIEKGFQMSILGLGDIVVPGYLVTHLFTMNGFSERERIMYGSLCIVGYGFGLMFTFAGLIIMDTAQPALIYLVPSTLIPVILLAVYRGDFKKMWHGVPYNSNEMIVETKLERVEGSEEDTESAPVAV